MTSKKKFFPSSSAFMMGDVVVTKYNSGCLRSILAKANGVRDGEIADIYQQVGRVAEDAHEIKLIADNVRYDRELPLSFQLSDKVEYSGRVDFYIKDTAVHEIKAHISRNTRREVIRNRSYITSHLAQLVSYMVRLRAPNGRIICSYYEDDDGTLVCQESRTFEVTIDDDGSILVDDSPSGYYVPDLLAHQQAAVKVLETGEIAPRPANWNQKYGGPCNLCPFKTACDKHDSEATTTEQFLKDCQSSVANQPAKQPPVAFSVKKKKEKK